MRKKVSLLLLLSFFVALISQAQTIHYVKPNGLGDGSSWTNAYGDLQMAIDAAKEMDEVWVAAGTYVPIRRADGTNVISLGDRFNSFVMRKNVAIYGSLVVGATTTANRDFTANKTILSGNIGDTNTAEDNAYHVVTAAGDLGTTALLDGFIIEEGRTEAATGTTNNISVNGISVASTRSPGIAVQSARSVVFKNLIVQDNYNASPDQHSGAIYVFTATADFYDVKFLNNVAIGASNGGGAVKLHGGTGTSATQARFFRVEFEGNRASNGAAMASTSNTTVTLVDCVFKNNGATSTTTTHTGGGAIGIFLGGNNYTITGTRFENNTAINGGAIGTRSTNNVISINNSTFIENKANSQNGGAVYLSGADLTVNINGSTFSKNRTLGTGSTATAGALGINSAGGKVDITGSTFEGNYTSGTSAHGGAVQLLGANMIASVVGATFTGNYTSGTSAQGGAVQFSGANMVASVVGTTFVGNSTNAANGGAIWFDGAAGNLTVDRTTFNGNKVIGAGSSYGGAIAILNSNNFIVKNSIFIGNTASVLSNSSGGAIAIVNSKYFEVNLNTFTSNSAANQGGAIRVLALTNPSLINQNKFEGNNSGIRGGAISIEVPNVNLVGNYFYGNSAASGGGVYITHAESTNVTTFVNNIFTNNNATGLQGGGAFLITNTANAVLYNCTFYRNTATNNGATGYAHSAARFTLNNCISIADVTTGNKEFGVQVVATNLLTLNNTLTTVYTPTLGSNNYIWNGTDQIFASTNVSDDNFLELSDNSVAKDKGNNSLLGSDIYYDFKGRGRIHNGIVDLGVYEFGGVLPPSPTNLNVNENAVGGTLVGKPIISLLGANFQWEIVAGNVGNVFEFNQNGDIQVKAGALIDYETLSSYVLMVKANNGVDQQIVTVNVAINNRVDKPGTPVVHNINVQNVASTYRPTLSGVAEKNGVLTIYVDGVAQLQKAQADQNGNWTYTFVTDLTMGQRTFHVVSSLPDLPDSEPSESISATLKVFFGDRSIKANNVLTPNGDFKNDTWYIENLTALYPNNEVLVFDKAGKIVFQQKNYDNTWDGTNKGKPLNAGTYYYLITTARDMDPIKGTINILR